MFWFELSPIVLGTLLLVLTASSFAENALPKRCGHSHVLANLTTFNRLHYEHVGATQFMRKRAGRRAKVEKRYADHEGMRIHVDYQLDNAEESTREFLMRELVPAAVSAIEATIQVKRPVEGPLELPRYCVRYYTNYPENCLEAQPDRFMEDPDWAFCGHAKEKDEFYESYETCRTIVNGSPAEGFECEMHTTPGVPGADLVLYVTAVESQYCEFAEAYAQYCSLDLDDNRPLAGAINFCPSSTSTSPDRLHHSIEVAVHELLHTLVFSETLFEKFVDDEGVQIPLNQVVQSRQEGGREVKRIITPKVVEAARNHFGCSILEGAELEDEGGTGTAGSHWETRTFQGELMDGMSGVNIASDRHAFSPLTMALLEDSGWYTVNWHNAVRRLLSVGLELEVVYSCEEYIYNNPDQPWFCKNAGQQGCTSDLHAYGRCHSDSLLNGCLMVTPFSNVDCKAPEHAENSLVDWGARYGAESFCLNVEHPMVQRETINGRSYETSQGPRTGDCYKIKCKKDGSYYLDVLGQKLHCSYPQQTISLREEFSQFISGGIDCPPGERVCSRLGCPDECSGHGWCHNKKCYCMIGYTGTNCSLRVCNAESTYCICHLFDGHSYGTCLPGTENIGQIIKTSEFDEDFQILKIAFDIQEVSEETLQESLPQALSDALPGVAAEDIQILEIDLDSNSDQHSLRLLSAHIKVVVGITTPDAVQLSVVLTNAVISGDFSEALTNAGLQFIDGSLLILDAETAKGSAKQDSVEVARAVMLVTCGIGFLVFALIVVCRCRSLRQRNATTTSPYNVSAAWPAAQRQHPLSNNYGAYPQPNPFM